MTWKINPSLNYFVSNLTAYTFQVNLLKTMLQTEDTFFTLAETCKKKCLIICDRGAMDATACQFRILYNYTLTNR